MTRDHVSIAIARSPSARGHAFLVGELERLGAEVGRARHRAGGNGGQNAPRRPAHRRVGPAVDEIADRRGAIDFYGGRRSSTNGHRDRRVARRRAYLA